VLREQGYSTPYRTAMNEYGEIWDNNLRKKVNECGNYQQLNPSHLSEKPAINLLSYGADLNT
jgi:hypothetical protein